MKKIFDLKNNITKSRILLLLFCLSTVFLGVGYASIDSITLDISGTAIAKAQEGIFITDVSYASSNNANKDESKINNYFQTMLNSSIVLSEKADSSISYEITIYNSEEIFYCFDKVEYLKLEDGSTYSNENIVFSLSGLDRYDVLNPKSAITFTINFYYKNGEQISNKILNSYLNFKFSTFYNIDYIGIEDNDLPNKIISGEELSLILENVRTENLNIQSGASILEINKDYTFDEDTYKLVIFQVIDNLIITVKDALPEGYYRLDYITSNGNQYIDTGVLGRTGLKSDITLSFENLIGKIGKDDYGILGARKSNNSGNYDRTYLLHYYDGFALGYGMYYNSHVFLVNDKKYDVHSELNEDAQFVQVDDQDVVRTEINSTYDIGLPLYLFAINQDGQPHYPSSINLYHCKIYDGDTLIRDFVPAMRVSDGEIGLYDIANDVFYENKGTQPFEQHSESYTYIDYIESNGMQYIDTGVNATSGLKTDLSFEFSSLDEVNNDVGILGARTVKDGSINRLYLLHYYNSFTLGYGNYYQSNSIAQENKKYNVHTELKNGEQYLKVDDTTIVSQKINNDYDLGINFYLFAVNENDKPKYYSSIKLYGCKIYDDTKVLRDFKPVIRKIDKAIGLLDVVNSKFYANNGIGDFETNNLAE